MAAKRNIVYYLVLNTVIPGLGQLFMGSWIRGLLMSGAALSCFLVAFLIMAMPLWQSMQMMFADEVAADFPKINLIHFAAAFVALLLVWVWSMVDAAVSIRLAAKRLKKEENSAEGRNV